MSTRHCYECDLDHPLTVEYFFESPKNEPPFDEICIACRKKLNKEKKERNKKAEDVLQRVEALTIEHLSREVVASGNHIPHSAELLSSLYEACGGVENFAKIFWTHFHMAEAGKAQRTKMLGTMVALNVKVVDHGGAKKPLELWTTEELEAEYAGRVMQAAQQLKICQQPEDERAAG